MVYLHCYTCMWWYIAIRSKQWMPPMDQAFDIDYSIYTSHFLKQYLYSLLYAVQVCLGSDIFPTNTLETAVSAIGLFVGGLINANIFGELAMIFSELDKNYKIFQAKIAVVNTAMINLTLPFELQQDVRHYVFQNEPSLQSQGEMQEFLRQIKPSMIYRIQIIQYTKVLQKVSIFRNNRRNEIDCILRLINIGFYEPEQKLMEQFDTTNRQVVITGQGICHVFRQIDSRKRICLGTLYEGSIKGETCAIFDSNPTITIESMSYCTIGVIKQKEFNEFLAHFNDLRKFIID